MLWKSQERRRKFMNTRTPLIAAFLIMASSAFAESISPLAQMDDLVFKCGTPPWQLCTDVELNKRQQVLGARACPVPASAACQSFLVANGDQTGAVQFMGNQANPATANGEFFMKCDTVPYRPCNMAETAQRDQYLKTLAKQEEASHQMIDPKASAPTTGDEIVVTGTRPLPPPFDAKDFQKELADSRADNDKKVVALPNNRIGIVNEDGTVYVCGKGQCDLKPRKPENVPGLTEALQADKSLNSGNLAINSDTPNGTPKGVPKSVGTPPPSQTPPANTEPSPATALGHEVVADLGPGGFGASSTGSGAPSGSGGDVGGGAGGTGTPTKAIPVSKAEVDAALAKVDSEGYSFNKNREADQKMKVIIGGAQAFNRSTTRMAEPPTDDKYLGKVRAASNSGE
jgi:hypothetical protein